MRAFQLQVFLKFPFSDAIPPTNKHPIAFDPYAHLPYATIDIPSRRLVDGSLYTITFKLKDDLVCAFCDGPATAIIVRTSPKIGRYFKRYLVCDEHINFPETLANIELQVKGF